eukprot:jgi/Pico_ML_1/52692/g3365.t1
MAIEKVYFVNNTSVIQDEVLAHRLGLVPIRADPRLFDFKGAEDDYHEKNTIVLKLKVVCTQEGDEVLNKNVYSSSLEWLPGGSEIPHDEEQKVIPSFGVMAPEQLFVEAVKVLMNKCDTCEQLLLTE